MGQKTPFIKNFTPIWFATVLGFGGIAIASALIMDLFDLLWLKSFIVFLVYFNLALFLLLFLIWALKTIFHFGALMDELKHPVMAGFHSLMPAATIMVAINFSKLGQNFSLWHYQGISVWFWVIGAIFEFFLLTFTVYFLIINEEMHINFVNGGWLVPPVAALLTPIAGLQIIEFVSDVYFAKVVLWINYFFFGAGLFMFLIIAVSLFSKIFFSDKLNPKIFPSLWIILVPFSLMALSLSLFAQKTGLYFPEYESAFLALAYLLNPMLIGAGIWMLVLLILLTYHYQTKIKLPYGVGWWAFVFPTASVAIASLNQAAVLDDVFFRNCGLAIYFFLVFVTLVVLIRTITNFFVKNDGKN